MRHCSRRGATSRSWRTIVTYRDYERRRGDARRALPTRGYREGVYGDEGERDFDRPGLEDEYDSPELDYEMPRGARTDELFHGRSRRSQRSASQPYGNWPGHHHSDGGERPTWTRQPGRIGLSMGEATRARPYYGPERIETGSHPFGLQWGSSILPSYGGHRGKGPKGYKRSDDRIREDVSEILMHDDDLDASDIEVEVRDGVVTLSGEVENRFEKRLAEDCAEMAPGVLDVNNRLLMRTTGTSGDRAERRASTAGKRPAPADKPGRHGAGSKG